MQNATIYKKIIPVAGLTIAAIMLLLKIFGSDGKKENIAVSNINTISSSGAGNTILQGNNSQQLIINNSSETKISPIAIVKGYYTICNKKSLNNNNEKISKFIEKIDTQKTKIVFLDIQIGISCPNDEDNIANLKRTETKDGVRYDFNSVFAYNQLPLEKILLQNIIPDNGLSINIFEKRGANSYSRLNVNSEGLADIIFGPYSVAVRGEDASIDFDLYPAALDSAQQQQVDAIYKALKK